MASDEGSKSQSLQGAFCVTTLWPFDPSEALAKDQAATPVAFSLKHAFLTVTVP